jgi:membrane-bound lytic murein transglycosylase D
MTYDLHLPAGTKDLFTKTIAEIPRDKRNAWRYHKLQPGETLESIARSYHVTASDIAFVNQLQPGQDIASPASQVDALVIPVAPAPTAARAMTRYRVRRGDTLVTVADRFDVTPAQLRRWNHLRTNAVVKGQNLYVAEPAHVAARNSRGRSARLVAAKGRKGAAKSARVAAASSSRVKGRAGSHGGKTTRTASNAHAAIKRKVHS